MIACAPLAHRTAFYLEGPDRFVFLQRLLTQDVRPCENGETVWSALLTPQGKFLHDLFLIPAKERLWIETDREGAPSLRAQLEAYRLRARVAFPDPMIGADVYALLGAFSDRLPSDLPNGTLVYPDPRHPELGARGIQVQKDSTRAGFAPAPFEVWERQRLALGIMDGRRDLLPGESWPAEGFMEILNGISFAKGCYIGQEVTARLHYRTSLRRHLRPVRTRAPLPAPGTTITRNGIPVGVLRSHIPGLALALLEDEAVRLHDESPEAQPLLCGEAHLEPFRPAWLSGR